MDSISSLEKRIDTLMVEMGLAQSRNQAQDLINSGQVMIVEGDIRKPVLKPSLSVNCEKLKSHKLQIEVIPGKMGRFVSRAALKLEGALDYLQAHPKDLSVLDVGVSTGGFSQVLLERGALRVVGIDVGHDQVHTQLKENPRFLFFEGVNARNLQDHPEVLRTFPKEGFDWAVFDVSFIGVEILWKVVVNFLKPEGFVLSLIKPQFQVGAEKLNRQGIAQLNKDEELNLEKQMRIEASRIGLETLKYFPSEIQGKAGNQEFFLWAQKNKSVG